MTILRNVISERDESGWRQLFRWYYWYKAFRQLYCLKFQLHTKSFISFWRYNESKVCCRCLPTPECPPIGPHSIEGLLTNYKNALDSAAREVLGPRLYAKKPGIYLRRLSIIDQRKNEANLSNAKRWPIPHHFECAVITWRHPQSFENWVFISTLMTACNLKSHKLAHTASTFCASYAPSVARCLVQFSSLLHWPASRRSS